MTHLYPRSGVKYQRGCGQVTFPGPVIIILQTISIVFCFIHKHIMKTHDQCLVDIILSISVDQSFREEGQEDLTCPVLSLFEALTERCPMSLLYDLSLNKCQAHPAVACEIYFFHFWKMKTMLSIFNFPADLLLSRFLSNWSWFSVFIFGVSQFLGEIAQATGL